MPFGRLDLEGTVEGVPVSLHTDYALGSDGVMETSSQYGFSLDIGSLAGTLQFTGVGESAGTFAVAEEAHEQDQVQVTLWAEGAEYQASGGEVVVNQNDESGMSGSFDVSFVEMPF
jgi:imidazole glycerol phosphate synthase subunit HisF